MEVKNWKIELTKEQFQALSKKDEFLTILTLARVENSLRFCQIALISAMEDKSPSGLRNKIASFLFACSVLFEGLKIAETLGEHFSQLNSFKEGFAKIIKDRNNSPRLSKYLNIIRNRVVFHFDKSLIADKLEDFDPKHYLFAQGSGKISGNVYYRLADDSFLHLLTKEAGIADTEEEIAQSMIEAQDMINRYTIAAMNLIAEVASCWNCYLEEDPEFT